MDGADGRVLTYDLSKGKVRCVENCN